VLVAEQVEKESLVVGGNIEMRRKHRTGQAVGILRRSGYLERVLSKAE
jgi:hypothetical protein